MAGKRSSTTRSLAEAAKRGRPRCATRSAYATAGNKDAMDEQQVVN